jgi:hypothetical protein
MDKKSLAAAREVSRQLKDKVLDDWRYPLPVQSPSIASALEPGAKPPIYRERYYGTTDYSADDSEDDGTGPGGHTIDDMYAFDSPESVGVELDRKLQERKKRKRKVLEEEMGYNTGLRVFLHRRNAWTGAVNREAVGAKLEALPLRTPPPKNSSDSSPVQTPTSSSSKASNPDPENEESPPSDSTVPDTDVLIPVAEPIMPSNHPVRKTLSNRSHSDLYEKLVRDSRTPAIPINLADMMQICVQGWRDEGNWPPKGAMAEPVIAARNNQKNKNRVAKAIAMRDDGTGTGSGGILANHKHLRQSVEGVKRIFRLSGDHSGAGPKSPRGFGGNHSHSHSQDQ